VEFVNIVQNKLKGIVKIINAGISNFTNGVYFELEDNYKK